MYEINFKASRRKSHSYGKYRQIIKTGTEESLNKDYIMHADDSIIIPVTAMKEGVIIIDCNKKTGVFTIKF